MEVLAKNKAETAPDHPDPRLRGRTYGVPYERVWQATLSVASSRRGWEITDVDDLQGIMKIEATTLVFRFVDDVTVRISLDEDAQTRVDVTSASRVGKSDLGKNTRRIRRFLKLLDRELATMPRPAGGEEQRRKGVES